MASYALDKALVELKLVSQRRVTKIPLPDDALLEEYEREIGFKFNCDYRYFLKEASNIFYGTRDPLVVTKGESGWGELKDAVREGRELGVPFDWLPICEDNGNYFCIVPSGQIRYWSADGSTDESWPDLATWVMDVWIKEC